MDQRLHDGTRVTINLPPRDARARLRDFDATVVALLDAAVVLQPDIDFDLIPGRTEDVFLSFVAGRGLVALKGALTRDGGGIRFTVQDGVRVRRRRAERIDVELPVTLDGMPGVTTNLSGEGALVRAAPAVALGDRIDIALALPKGELQLRGRVVRHGDGLIALQFLDGACGALADFITERRAA
jgi:hypothetical protein